MCGQAHHNLCPVRSGEHCRHAVSTRRLSCRARRRNHDLFVCVRFFFEGCLLAFTRHARNAPFQTTARWLHQQVGTECGAGGWLPVSRTRSTADCCICNRFLAAFSAIIVLSASGVFICKATGVLSWEKPTDHSGERTGAQRHEGKLEHLLASTQRKVRQCAQPRPVLANLSICHSPHTCETSVPARPQKGSI